MKSKVYESFHEAVQEIPDGATIMMHAFSGAGGIAQNLIVALRDHGAKNLTIITCGAGVGQGIQKKLGLRPFVTPTLLAANGQVRKIITGWPVRMLAGASIVSDAKASAVEEGIIRGEIEWEPTPQGILAERIHAGAAGLGGFYSPVGLGTVVEQGKEKKIINGKEYILEMPLRTGYAFIRAHRADKMGNLIYRGTARSFNPLIALAADMVIAEVDEIVEVGGIDPEHVITPGVFVDKIIEVSKGEWQ